MFKQKFEIIIESNKCITPEKLRKHILKKYKIKKLQPVWLRRYLDKKGSFEQTYFINK